MKTTIELPDTLAADARRVAAARGTTLKSLIEEGLRRELDRIAAKPVWQPNADFAYGTGGLTAEAEQLSWSQIRELVGERNDIA